ncbi:MAG: hypothetical protein NT018_07010 [Armatimonadetes bacterium]|nr:hypothetical protein [Armatimonadota bacterium]
MAPCEPKGSKKYAIAPLFADTVGVTLGSMKWGRGTVIVMPGSSSLTNRGIGKGGNLNIVLNALDYRMPGGKPTVTFDEFHHGYGTEEGIMSLISVPAKLGLAALAFAFLLLLFATSRRFGRIVPLMEGTRQRGEYLGSMSALLRKAHATDIVREELGRRFINDVARSLGLSPNAGLAAIMEAASSRHPDKVSALNELCMAATEKGSKSNEASVFALARKWHKMRKELTK